MLPSMKGPDEPLPLEFPTLMMAGALSRRTTGGDGFQPDALDAMCSSLA